MARLSAAASRLTTDLRNRARPRVQAAQTAVDRVVHSPETQRLAKRAGDAARTGGTHASTVARTAGTHATAAARAGVSSLAAFATGIGYLWLGFVRFLRSPMLWLLAAIPIAVVFIIVSSIQVGSVLLSSRLTQRLSGLTESWPRSIQNAIPVTLELTVNGMAEAVVAFLILPLSVLVGAPFYILMTRVVERRLGYGQAPPATPSVFRTIGFAIVQTIRVTIVASLGWLLLVPLLLIPGLNIVAALGVVILVDGFLIGLLAIGAPLHHRGVRGLRNHFRYAWSHRAYLTGFGATAMLVLAVPFLPLRWFATPAVFIGAVLLYRRIDSRELEPTPELEPAPEPEPAPESIADDEPRAALG